MTDYELFAYLFFSIATSVAMFALGFALGKVANRIKD